MRGGRAKISVVSVRFCSGRKAAVGSVGSHVGRSEDHYRLLSIENPRRELRRGFVAMKQVSFRTPGCRIAAVLLFH